MVGVLQYLGGSCMTLAMRITHRVPSSGFPLAFLRGSALVPSNVLGFMDRSRLVAENRTGLQGHIVPTSVTGELADTDIVVSTRSLLDFSQSIPRYLPFRHTIGS